MTDDELVTQELAALDQLAAGFGEEALNAHVRAYCIRRIPVGLAAKIMRQETLDSLAGRRQPLEGHWAAASWQMEWAAKRGGIGGWSVLPMAAEIRSVARRHHDFPAAARAARDRYSNLPIDERIGRQS